MDLHSAFSGWLRVDMCKSPLGEQKKAGETEGERSKPVISAPLCVSQQDAAKTSSQTQENVIKMLAL